MIVIRFLSRLSDVSYPEGAIRLRPDYGYAVAFSDMDLLLVFADVAHALMVQISDLHFLISSRVSHG